nr:co-chaperone GroES [uncultured Desulfuromonas sp.]
MNIRPLQDRLIVECVEEETTTAGGIIIPDTASKEKPQEGVVVAAGKGKVTSEGKVLGMDVKVGDRVLFGKYAGSEIKVDGKPYLMMREDDILGVLEK